MLWGPLSVGPDGMLLMKWACLVYSYGPFSTFRMSVIKVRNLRKKYGEFEALKGVSFEVGKGEIVGFLGPNGAGKTTTMKILTCFMAATGGTAQVAGFDCFTDGLEVRKRIGYLPENNPLYLDMNVIEYLQYRADLHDIAQDEILKRVNRVVEETGLYGKAYKSIGTLSKGYRQRVGLAASLIHDPDILILDEPTAGLDPNQIVEIRTLIKQLGKEKTVILCSHLLAEVELTCNRIIIIDQGNIVASGTPNQLRNMVDGHANIKLVVRGETKKAHQVIQQIGGVRDVVPFSVPERGATGFDIVTVKNRDLRPEIAEQIIKNELQLLDIHREVVTLEAVFNQVTQNPVIPKS